MSSRDGRRPGRADEDDEDSKMVTLRVKRRIREAVRRIASFDEVPMEAVTHQVMEAHIEAYEARTGLPIRRALKSNAKS